MSTLVQETLLILKDFQKNKPVYLLNLIASKHQNFKTSTIALKFKLQYQK